MEISVKKIGTTQAEFVKKLELQFISINDAMEVLGEKARDYMRDVISTEKHRKLGSKDNLENHINVYVEPGGRIVGVGSRAELDHFAPYWFLINYGGWSAMAKAGGYIWGSFDGLNPPLSEFAGTGVGTGSFFEGIPASDGFMHKMQPKNPVWAMNYIEKTVNWLSSIWRVHMSGAVRKVQTFQK